jgi:predicted transcriptional regulator
MKTILKTIRIKTSVLRRIEKLAELENRNVNNMIETALIDFLDQNLPEE